MQVVYIYIYRLICILSIHNQPPRNMHIRHPMSLSLYIFISSSQSMPHRSARMARCATPSCGSETVKGVGVRAATARKAVSSVCVGIRTHINTRIYAVHTFLYVYIMKAPQWYLHAEGRKVTYTILNLNGTTGPSNLYRSERYERYVPYLTCMLGAVRLYLYKIANLYIQIGEACTPDRRGEGKGRGGRPWQRG